MVRFEEEIIDAPPAPFGYKAALAAVAGLVLLLAAFFAVHALMVREENPAARETGPSEIVRLDETNFEEVTREGVVLVEFWMHNCPPCIEMEPSLEKIAREMKGKAIVAKINGPENMSVARRYIDQGYPTLVLFKNGKVIDVAIGLQYEGQIRSMLKAAINNGAKTEPEA